MPRRVPSTAMRWNALRAAAPPVKERTEPIVGSNGWSGPTLFGLVSRPIGFWMSWAAFSSSVMRRSRSRTRAPTGFLGSL